MGYDQTFVLAIGAYVISSRLLCALADRDEDLQGVVRDEDVQATARDVLLDIARNEGLQVELEMRAYKWS